MKKELSPGPITHTCPGCAATGRVVPATTLESLVFVDALTRFGHLDGFRFCRSVGCPVAYYRECGGRIEVASVRVRIGVKETASPRPICYCFGVDAEAIEADLAARGSTDIPARITAKCKAGLDRCAQENPRGACCLGDLRRLAKAKGTCCSG